MPAPDASVVISTRDRPELLRQAIGAIKAQDHDGPIETIVVFDQSEVDASVASDDPLRPVRVTSNLRTPGLPGGRNTGAELATGRVLAFCDDDDEWLPGKLRQQLAILDEHAEVDVVVSGVRIDHAGTLIDRPCPERIAFADLIRDRIMQANLCTAAVRRDAFWDRIGPVDESLPGGYAEDYEWMLRASRQAPLAAVPEPQVRILWHQSSFYVARWRMIDDALAALLERYPEFDDDPVGLARVLGQRAFARAAAGRRKEAVGMVRRTLAASRREPRAYLALLVAARLVSADRVLGVLRRFGRSI